MTQKFPKMNFHTHTTYCDGKESVDAMLRAALEKGFVRLGFSGHCFNTFRPQDAEIWCMSLQRTEEYIAEVRKVAEQYKDRIEILCGIEQDICSDAPTEAYDYVIGSVHYAEKDGIYYCVDESPQVMEKSIREGFEGDVYSLVKRFFEMEAQVVEKTGAAFIGHFDLITKFNEENRFFDPLDKRYRDASMMALEALLETEKPFEINTGAMYRGLRKEPYPSIPLLKEIHRRKGEILLSSDSHDGASLGFAFDEMAQLAKDIGFRSVKALTAKGFLDFEL